MNSSKLLNLYFSESLSIFCTCLWKQDLYLWLGQMSVEEKQSTAEHGTGCAVPDDEVENIKKSMFSNAKDILEINVADNINLVFL